ncbi:tyrosine-type recombinase/integrase [Curtobacterium flaccumfaciens pv. beticola]|uniref:tyrosine-type recombinase/integrase n=1 Tax=Curtobacterium flaccumfaciens TaxID=2035 RepID=UPI00349FCB0F|nr:tyrosine-type recombinase/integrase [Curtobacterium flaccumfaciens pv. basellae]
MYWQVALDFPRTDGRRRRVIQRSRDYESALQKLAILRLRRAEETPRPPAPAEVPTAPPLVPSSSLAAWLRYWLAEIVDQEVRPKTAESYRSLVRLYIEPAIGARDLVAVTTADVRELHRFMRERGLAASTVRQGHRVLAIALKQAHREGYTYRDVGALVKPPKPSAPALTTLGRADAARLLQVARGDRLESRWVAALLTGSRQGELLGLELDRVTDELDLSWQLQRLTWQHGCGQLCGRLRGAECPDRRIIAPSDHERRHLVGGFWLTRPKTAAGTRQVPLVSPLRELVEERVAAAATEPNPHGLLWTSGAARSFGQPIDASADSRAWRQLATRAGVTGVRLHDARHFTVDLLYAAGVPEVVAMELIGHSSIAMTRRYRSGASQETLRRAMERSSGELTEFTPVR